MADPLVWTLAYQKAQFSGGLPGQPTVFDTLVSPPATGVAATAAGDAGRERARVYGAIGGRISRRTKKA
jgi:hypothetical protein